MKQILLFFIIILAFFWLLILTFQRHLIYFPSEKIPNLNPYAYLKLQEVKLRTQDEEILRCWYKPAENNEPTILYLHGNAGNIENRMPLAKQLIQGGFGVFLLEYRGYGGNKGKPTEQGLYEDARTALKFLHQKGKASKQIVLLGESLGTGVAIQMAVEDNFCALVLQSAYTSFSDLKQLHYPWIWIKPWDEYNSLSKIPKVHAPLLFLHAKEDTLVPISQASRLFQQASEPKEFISFEGVNHNTLWLMPNFTKKIIGFISKHCR